MAFTLKRREMLTALIFGGLAFVSDKAKAVVGVEPEPEPNIEPIPDERTEFTGYGGYISMPYPYGMPGDMWATPNGMVWINANGRAVRLVDSHGNSYRAAPGGLIP